MNRTTLSSTPATRRRRAASGAAFAVAGVLVFAACSGGGSSATNTAAPTTNTAAPTTNTGVPTTGVATSGSAGAAASTGQVLPVDTNPIDNPATAQAFVIDSVLVENNEDANGKAVDDHLEIALTNTSRATLAGFEVYYTLADPTTGLAENYYTRLPSSFTIDPGGTRTVHFDSTGAADHFPVNKFSLYYTDTNALDVTVEVSANDAAPQTVTVQKDAGGAEAAD